MKKSVLDMTYSDVMDHFINPEYTEYKMKKQTKHEKIITLYKQGMKPKDIAKKAKTTVQNVYAATHKYRKDLQKKEQTITFETPEAKSVFNWIKKLFSGI